MYHWCIWWTKVAYGVALIISFTFERILLLMCSIGKYDSVYCLSSANTHAHTRISIPIEFFLTARTIYVIHLIHIHSMKQFMRYKNRITHANWMVRKWLMWIKYELFRVRMGLLGKHFSSNTTKTKYNWMFFLVENREFSLNFSVGNASIQFYW